MVLGFEKLTEVGVKRLVVTDNREGEPACELFGYTHSANVDPQDRLCRGVCPVNQPRVQFPNRIETRAKGGGDWIIWGLDIGSVLEPRRLAG